MLFNFEHHKSVLIGSAGDVRDPLDPSRHLHSPQVDAWIQHTVEELGTLDGAANLAGVINKSLGTKNVVETGVEEWEFVIGVNLTGVMFCLKSELGEGRMRVGDSV